MKKSIDDAEVQILAGIAATLQADYLSNDVIWDGSPFAWIKTRPSRQIGAIGEKLVAGWLAARGFNIARSPDSDADRLIEGKRVEIKFSTLWTDKHIYKFQQLRDQKYDFAICLGVSPFDAHCWVIDKKEILRHWKETKSIQSQHGGASGSDAAWIEVDPMSPHEWITDYGGKLGAGLDQVSLLTGYTPPDPNEED